MSSEEPAIEDRPATPADPADEAAPVVPADDAEPRIAEAPEPVETRTTVEVGLVRSVRYGPIMIGGIIVGAALAALAALFFPIEEGADYTMGQVVGFVAVLGAVIGLALGALLALILGVAAKRRRGAAIAVLTDVR